MKKFLTKTFNSKPITVCGVLFILLTLIRLAKAAELQEARVSQVIQDVRLMEAHAASHPAAVNDKVIKGSAVRTGAESRAELTFNDLTITRLGANTIFSFTAGARQAELTHGAILLQVPPNAPSVRANTTSVTVSVMGGTALLAAGPPTKFMVLEGTGTIYPLGHPEKAVTVHGGEMVLAEHGRTSKPEKFDVKLVLATSPLVTDFAPLANLPLIQTVVNDQVALQQVSVATSQPLIKDLINVLNVTSQSADTNPAVVQVRVGTPTPAPTPSITPPPTPTPSTTPPPTPSKFGTPTTITSPNPYMITSGTTITTDPSITTNGVTDFGKIYRGPTDDGAFTLWAFGSTSAFDTALHIDTEFFANPNNLPIAAFKFQSLLLNGNPTIDLSNGGVTKLALIGVDGITSGPPGGTLTFTGLDLLALGTVNGSINLTSDVSFQGLNGLAMYARGAGSDLILDCPISNIGALRLAAEGSIQLTNPGTMSVGSFDATAGVDQTLSIGGSLLLNGAVNFKTQVLPGTTLASGANLTLNITGDYTNSSTTEVSQLRVINEAAHIGTGGNIDVNIGGDLTTSGPTSGTADDFDVAVRNTNGQIDNGGNVAVMVNGNISTHGPLSLLVENYDESANAAGHIGTGGNVSLTTGGNVTADFASIAINNRGGGRIDSGVNLIIDIAGALTTMENGSDFLGNTASLSIAISSRYDDTAGNIAQSFIGGDANLLFQADSASIGGILDVALSDRGGTIDGNALLTFNTTHDLNVSGVDVTNVSDAAEIELLNDGGTTGIQSPFGGTIHGDATLQVSAANLSVPNGSLDVLIENKNGGVIDSNATMNLNVAGNLTTGHYATFWIANLQNGVSNGLPGGSIGSAAVLSINAANISVGNDFFAAIRNQRGAGAPGPGAGSIGTDALLTITTGSFSVGGVLDAEIDNFNNGSGSGTGGRIGESAAVNFNTNNAVTSGGATYFQILNESLVAGSPGGSIGGDATIDVGVGDLTSGPDQNGNALVLNIDNRGGSIGGNSGISFGASGSVNAQGNAIFQILNFNDGTSGPGAIGADVVLDVSAVNFSTTGFLYDAIDNSSGGSITSSANLNFHLTGDLTTQGDATFTINNSNGGLIGANAMSDIEGGSISIPGKSLFQSAIFNQGGTITGNAELDVNPANITANSLLVQIDNSNKGVIGGIARLGMNVSGTGTITTDATAQILGSDGAASAEINIQGNYNVGGTFLLYVDGSGQINFNNAATAHADVLKAGVFGANGSIQITGGMLSADTTLKLYAPGSNGNINFFSNVTLGGNALTKILAANTIFISNNVVVTIGGSTPIDVYTNNADYTGFGGNGTTTGTFAGAGANNPQPLANAPPFNPATPSHHTSGGGIPRPSHFNGPPQINVNNTAELLALLDGSTVGPDGKVRIPGSKSTVSPKDLSRMGANRLLRADRRMLLQQTRDRDITHAGSRRL